MRPGFGRAGEASTSSEPPPERTKRPWPKLRSQAASAGPRDVFADGRGEIRSEAVVTSSGRPRYDVGPSLSAAGGRLWVGAPQGAAVFGATNGR